jgi:hypothetical protein
MTRRSLVAEDQERSRRISRQLHEQIEDVPNGCPRCALMASCIGKQGAAEGKQR